MAPAAALLLALTLGAETELVAGVRVESTVRHTDPPPFPGEERALDLSAFPRLGLRVSGGGAALGAVYSPRLSVLAVGPHPRHELMHEGDLRLQRARGPAFRLEAFGNGAVGRTDLVSESLTTQPGG